MKYFSKLLMAAIGIISIFSACKKLDTKDDIPVYSLGSSPVLSSSTATVALTLADTTRPVIAFSWTNPKYSNDSATTKYILEIDTTGKNVVGQTSIILRAIRARWSR